MFCFVALFLITIILFFSSQSGGQSHTISKSVASSIAKDWNNLFSLNLDDTSISFLTKILDYPIRKMAHVIEYFLLGFGVFGTIYLLKRNKTRLVHIILTLFLVIMVASLDEINQFYSGGRGSSIRDVFIDTIGGFLGIYLVIAIHDFVKHIKNLFAYKK